MTSKQKDIINVLIQGGSISHFGRGAIRLRDAKTNPVAKLSDPSFYYFAHGLAILKKTKNVWVISRSKIRGLHGNNFIKKLYLSSLK